MSATVQIYCQKDKVRKDGTSPIYFRLRLNSSDIKIATRKYVDAKLFDNSKGTVKKGGNNATKLNTWLSLKKAKLEKIILDIENDDRPLSLELSRREYEAGGSRSFIDFCREEIKNPQGNLVSSTLQENGYCINNLENEASCNLFLVLKLAAFE